MEGDNGISMSITITDRSVEAKIWARTVDVRFGVILVFGYSPPHIEALLARRNDLELLCLDPDSFQSSDDNRVRIFHTLQDIQGAIQINTLKRRGLSAVSMAQSRVDYAALYEEWLTWIKNLAIAVRVDLLTGLRFAREWTRNVILNMKWLPQSASVVDSFDEWTGLPAAIISAGPSLEEALPALRQYGDRMLTIAVGSTIPVLFRAGIEPDLIAGFDGGLNHWRGHFRGLRITAPLIYDPIIHPWVLDEHAGPKIVMNCWGFDWYADLVGMKLGKVAVGPSIANSALKAAIAMGANPIFLIGQDLAFRNGRFHAPNVHLSGVPVALPDSRMTVAGVSQESVETSLTMYTFLKHFEHTLRKFPTTEVINVNGTAKIEGTLDRRLSQVPGRLNKIEGISLISLEKKRMKGKLLGGCACDDVERLRGYFRAVLDVALQIRDRADVLDLKNAVRARQMSPLAFLLSPILTDPRIESDPTWMVRRVRSAIDYAVPYLQQTLEEI